MIPFEELDNKASTANYVSAAKHLLVDGWTRRNYPALMLSRPIPWALASHDQRSWNFHIHALDMIDPLLRAHSHTSDTHYLSHALPIALDWIRVHHDADQAAVSPFAWYDMAVGLRAYRLAYLLDAAGQHQLLDEPSREALSAALHRHAEYLADDANIAFHSNHGYYQVAGQLAMGRRFANESPEMAQAMEQGQVRLKAMLSQQFASDGVHREHSPDYHRMVYDTLKALIDSGLVEDEETIASTGRIERALSWFVLPNQRIANFGDSDYRLMSRAPTETERKWKTPEMRFVISGGKTGHRPEKTVAAFPEGGYFVVRKPATDAPTEPAQDSYLAQTAAFHSRTHKHADDLSFIWSDRGSDLLVDAGRYGYIGKAEQGSELWLDGHWYNDPNRVHCESTRAHNTLEFDHRNYPRKGVKPYGSALRRWAEDGQSGVIAVETECRHFRSIRRARVLVFKPAQWLLVFDWFHDNEQAPHVARQWFHLAPQLQLLQEAEGYHAAVPGSAQPLRAVSLLDGATGSRPYLAEQEPRMQGWWSSKERDIVPAYAFCHEMSGASQGSIATLFSFSNKLKADLSWSKANVSGRKAQFRWTDESGVHELKLDRSEDLPALGLSCSLPARD